MSAEALLGLVGPAPQSVHDAAPPRSPAVRMTNIAVDGGGSEVRDREPVDELCDRMASICASAVDPLEVAAALEFDGLGDRSAREQYGSPDVFALAEVLYRRVPRQPAEPPAAADPYPRRILRPLLHGVLYGLPAVCFPAALGLLSHDSTLTMMIVSMMASWGLSQGLAFLGYRRLGWDQTSHARRLLRAGLGVGLGIVVLAMALAAVFASSRFGPFAFGVGQGAYMLGACVLMVLGIERALLVVLAPSVLGATAFLLLGRPPMLEHAVWATLAATPTLAIVLAVVFTRTDAAVPGPVVVPAELRAAVPSLFFGVLAAALVATPIALGLSGRPGVNVGAVLAAVPLSLSMGAAEWILAWYRRTTQRLVRHVADPRAFASPARLTLVAAVLLYLTGTSLLLAAAAFVALTVGFIDVAELDLVGLAAYLALGGAMFVALLLHAFGVWAVTLIACFGALAFEFVLRGWGVVAQLLADGGLFGLLLFYAVVVLGRAIRHI